MVEQKKTDSISIENYDLILKYLIGSFRKSFNLELEALRKITENNKNCDQNNSSSLCLIDNFIEKDQNGKELNFVIVTNYLKNAISLLSFIKKHRGKNISFNNIL